MTNIVKKSNYCTIYTTKNCKLCKELIAQLHVSVKYKMVDVTGLVNKEVTELMREIREDSYLKTHLKTYPIIRFHGKLMAKTAFEQLTKSGVNEYGISLAGVALMDKMALKAFNMTYSEAVKAKICLMCKNEITEDDLAFNTSGICFNCGGQANAVIQQRIHQSNLKDKGE